MSESRDGVPFWMSALRVESGSDRVTLSRATAEDLFRHIDSLERNCIRWEQSCKKRSEELNSLGEYVRRVEEEREDLRRSKPAQQGTVPR